MNTSSRRPIPELLAPAGSEEALLAAVENGADAVYFGIAGLDNFNARVRAKNIPREKLRETMTLLHRRGVRGYVTLNTLVLADEFDDIETLLREFVEADVDAILVQDFGVAALAQRYCPTLPLHASTQMSLTSAEGIVLAQSFGIRRVVLPRELSLRQIDELRKSTDVELEAFVHGALCISFSGQCYASLTLGGRSANRGRCAQPCRLPYELIDEKTGRSFGDAKQLLSPCDLAALPLLPKLVATGIRSLKIEGRLKPPEYVAEVTKTYRQALDILATGSPTVNVDLQRLELTFSRGSSTGWLEGVDPRRLVPGQIMSHRGTEIGKVIEIRRDAAVVKLSGSVRRGDGVLFENESIPERSQGGRVYEIIQRRESVLEARAGDRVLLTFANDSLDPYYVVPGQSVRKTNDPRLQKELRKNLESHRIVRKVPIGLNIRAAVGEPIRIDVKSGVGAEFRIVGETNLEAARKHPLTAETLQEQFGRLGETIYELTTVDAEIEGTPMLPLSVMGQLRREMVERLDDFVASPKPVAFGPSLKDIRQENKLFFERLEADSPKPDRTVLHLLFRDENLFSNEDTLQRCIDAGCRSFYVEPKERSGYATAADLLRKHAAGFIAVAPRILKPGETKILDEIAAVGPDAVLVRNLTELTYFRNKNFPVIVDFSLNVVNDLSFRRLLDWGAERITLGFDLDEKQYAELLKRIPVSRIERIVAGRIPLFSSEHCFWRANLVASGKPCGNLCRVQPLRIRDRVGAIHPVRSDFLCRNYVESAEPLLIERNPDVIRHLRIEWDPGLGDPDALLKKFG